MPGPAGLFGTRRRTAAASLAAVATLATLTGACSTQTADAATAGRTFYLSPTGSDSADGRSPATAWRTISRANGAVFAPGDSLLLQGGAQFSGMLYLDAADAGDAAAPVVVGSYGTGRATIAGAGQPGVYVYNTAGLQVRDLVVVGDAQAYRTKGGISFYADRPARVLTGITVTGVEVSGFKNGVEIGSATAPGGFRSVRVADSKLHDNMEAGLATYGPAFRAAAPAYAHEGVTVERVAAFRNLGDATNTVRNTGSGIVLGSVQGGAVRQSRAYGNGAACIAPEGPVGIWTYDSNRVVLERNLSHDNRTGASSDGGGFDLDQNVSNSVMQYNLSYGNDGYGYLVYTAQGNAAHRGNVVRFNISQNDVRKTDWYGGITVVAQGPGSIRNTAIYHNTVVSSVHGDVRPAPLKAEGALTGVTVRNNVFVANGTGRVVDSPTAYRPAAVALQGNTYHSVGTWAARWGTTHPSLAAWRSATGQERLGTTATGSAGDPRLVDPYTPVAVTDPARLPDAAGFRLGAASPAVGTGLDLRTLFGVNVGSRDFYGTPVSATATTRDVGTAQRAR